MQKHKEKNMQKEQKIKNALTRQLLVLRTSFNYVINNTCNLTSFGYQTIISRTL